ncbi:protein NRT1/ PTR FAMILY 7.1-like [Trifolium pratense]|uniref:protein NRT1/ PTR FAMILY 7.1-like n=1 Tax=Trifolium pratense TaxID=57577 RepID=UPI001E698274|nr:protein NRT1/ PTR FAMILY 7.1-like [Trifolium pratense]
MEKSGRMNEMNKTGGIKVATLLLVNQALATLGFFGVGVNLVLFLTRVLGQDNAEAANNVSKWTGTVYMFSLVGAFLSDSYWGRYLTCTIFQIFFILGLALSCLSSWRFLINPSGCGDGHIPCKPSTIGVNIFYFSIYLVAFGYGGHQPTLATFGADQYDEKNPKERSLKVAFFCYFYFSLNVGSLFSNTVLVYYEDTGKWTMGFLVSFISAIIAFLTFLSGSPQYRYLKPSGNPVVRVAQVFTAVVRKWGVDPPKADKLFELVGSKSAIKGCRKILHSDDLRLMDKAATITENDDEESRNNPWRLCTVTQVEETKCVLRMLPIWLCTITYSVVFTQMASLFVEQGDVMNSKIGEFRLPAASMSIFDICSVLVCTGIYRKILVPLVGRLSGNPRGISELERMGIGLIFGMLSMVASGITEIVRLRNIICSQKTSSMSIFYQIPQYVLMGASEVFMYVGQLEFFNGQAPDGIKSFGSSLCMASMSLGNYVSSMLVNIIMEITARGHDKGWISENLNKGHMDRFFFLLAGLVSFDFVIYLFCAKWYKSINVQGDQEELELDDSNNSKSASKGQP